MFESRTFGTWRTVAKVYRYDFEGMPVDEYGVPTGDPPVDPDAVIKGQIADGIKTRLPLAVRCDGPSQAVLIIISEFGAAWERCTRRSLCA